MPLEDLSLDEIIKQRKTINMSKKRFGPNPKPPFPQKKFPNANQQTNIVDARLLIKSKAKFTDARQKLNAKTVAVVDARQRLEQKKKQSQNFSSQPVAGKIPKITIRNNLAASQRSPNYPITFHVTQGAGGRGRDLKRKHPNTLHAVAADHQGIKIAVKNDLVQPKPVPWESVTQSAPSSRTRFEKLKITTINKDAVKQPPPQRIKPPPATLGKRTMPMEVEPMDVEDSPSSYPKHRRQQRSPEEPPSQPPRNTRPSQSIRPMSRHNTAPMPAEDSHYEEPSMAGPSPIEGTKLKVVNLHQVVTEDDILELFSVLGAVRRARLVKPGEAEVVYVKHENAMAAYKKYNNRDLDGQPMRINFMSEPTEKAAPVYSWMKEVKSSRKKSEPGEVTELHSGVLQQALFKGGSTGTSTRPVVFTVKI